MLIASKFRDYYDTVRRLGVDKSIIYKRELKEIEQPRAFENIKMTGRDNLHSYYLIGFCGKTYCLIIYYPRPKMTHFEWWSPPDEFYFNYDDYCAANPKDDGYKWGEQYGMSIKSFYENYNNKDNLQYFLDLDAPVFVYDIGSRLLSVNPELKKFNFQKVVDPFQAFQKLSQFLSNELAHEKPIAPTPDKYKILAHNMDKWSFRNPDPPKRKQK